MCLLIELPVPAAKRIKGVSVVRTFSCEFFANPAELVSAERARHVIAAAIFLDLSLTDWTERYVTLLLSPPFKLVLQVALTGDVVAVPFFPTAETNALLAVRARQSTSIQVISSQTPSAILIGAKT
jgi:hypothetical protein